MLFLVLLIRQTIQNFIGLCWTARMSLVFHESISLLPWPLEWEPCPALDDGRLSFMSFGVLTMPCLPEKLSFIPKDTCLQTWQYISLGKGSCFLVLVPPSANPAIIVHRHNRLRGWAWVSKLSHLQSKPCLRICNPQSHWLRDRNPTTGTLQMTGFAQGLLTMALRAPRNMFTCYRCPAFCLHQFSSSPAQ